MSIDEILLQVHDELKNCDAWEITCVQSSKRIKELFRENNIPEDKYAPWMANNVLPTLCLK